MSSLVDRMFSDNNKITKVGLEKFAKGGYLAIKDMPPEFVIRYIHERNIPIEDLPLMFFVGYVEKPSKRYEKVFIRECTYLLVRKGYLGRLKDGDIQELIKLQDRKWIHTSYISSYGYLLDQSTFDEIKRLYLERFHKKS